MAEPVTTFAIGVLLADVAKGVAANVVQASALHVYGELREQFTRLEADPNHDLQKAALRSFWLAMLHAAAEYGHGIGADLDRKVLLPAKTQQILTRCRSTTIFGATKEERQRVQEFYRQLIERVDNVGDHDLSTQKQVAGALEQVECLIEGDGGPLRAELTARALEELRLLWPDAPRALEDRIRKSWFYLFTGAFQFYVKKDAVVSNILNAKMLAKLTLANGAPLNAPPAGEALESLLDAQEKRIVEALTAVVREEHEETRAAILEDGEETRALIRDVVRPEFEGPVPLMDLVVGELRARNDQVFGRDEEIAELYSLLADPRRPSVQALVAPPGYGKSSLLRGMLQRNEAPNGVGSVLCFDCQNGLSLAKILDEVARLAGGESLKELSGESVEKQVDELARSFDAPGTWLIFQNTEDVLDHDCYFSSNGLEALVSRLEKYPSRARLLIESRLQPRLRNGARVTATKLGEKLLGGMMANEAVAWVQEIGAECGLAAKSEEGRVRELIARLHGVPLWIEGSVNFLRNSDRQGLYGLADLLHEPGLWAAFDADDREDREKGFQRLTRMHVDRLGEDARQLLGFTAFFSLPLPQEVMEVLIPRTQLGLPLNELLQNRLLSPLPQDPFGTKRYDLPAGLRSVVQGLHLWSVDKDAADALLGRSADFGNHAEFLLCRDCSEAAIEIYRELIEGGRRELAADLALAQMSRAIALQELGRNEEALAGYEEAIGAYRELIEGGRRELAAELALALRIRMECYASRWRWGKAAADRAEATGILRGEIADGKTYLQPRLDFLNRWPWRWLGWLKRA